MILLSGFVDLSKNPSLVMNSGGTEINDSNVELVVAMQTFQHCPFSMQGSSLLLVSIDKFIIDFIHYLSLIHI